MSLLSPRLRRLTLAGLLAIAPASSFAHDFVRDSAPMKWVDQAMIEDLPPLKYPSFYEDFDKAQAQVRHFRIHREAQQDQIQRRRDDEHSDEFAVSANLPHLFRTQRPTFTQNVAGRRNIERVNAQLL